jgi:phytoene dehydrogenase-like protein
LFEEKIETDWAPKMRKNVTGSENVFVALGVKADLTHYPYSMVFPLKEKIEFAENEFSELRIYNYAKYSGFAPKDCTSLTCILLAPSYDYWKKAKEDGTYKEKKDALAQKFIETLSKFIPEVTKDSVEVYDVATPLTYERYCSAYQGSWMSIWKPKTSRLHYPQTIKNLEGAYFAGQRIMMPGGLPIAVYTGRRAVQLLCRDNNIEFV